MTIGLRQLMGNRAPRKRVAGVGGRYESTSPEPLARRPSLACFPHTDEDEILPMDPDDPRWDALLPEEEPYGPAPESGDFWVDADVEDALSRRRAAAA